MRHDSDSAYNIYKYFTISVLMKISLYTDDTDVFNSNLGVMFILFTNYQSNIYSNTVAPIPCLR